MAGSSSQSKASLSSSARAWELVQSPTGRFFLIGALLFLVHRLMTGDPRVIEVSPGVKADLERRFRDHQGRAPTPLELDKALETWKRDEALYREALEEGLDRDDPTIRTVLADKVRARAALSVQQVEPTQAELEQWLATHRELYETPRRYQYEMVVFPRSEEGAAARLAEYERALSEGKEAPALGRPVIGATLTVEELRKRLGTSLADRIVALAPGRWERVDSDASQALVRLKRVEGGGTPSFAELRPRLVADVTFAKRQQAVERAVAEVVARYRFQEQK